MFLPAHATQTAGPAPVAGTPDLLYRLWHRHYDPTVGRFASLDPYPGDTSLPASLHKYVYAHDDPVNNVDPSGQFSIGTLGGLAIGTSLRTIGVGAAVGGVIGGVGYFAGTPGNEWSTLGALRAIGLGALAGAFGVTLIGSAFFAAQGIYEGVEVWRDPNSTGLQKALGSVNIILGLASGYFLRGQVRSQVDEWARVYSKLPLRTEMQRDLDRIKQAYNSAAQEPVKFGKTTIYFADNPRVAGGVIDENSFYLTRAAFERGDDFLVKVLIEENVHIQRIRSGAVAGGEVVAGQEVARRAEEGLVGDMVENIFTVGRERRWW
ncbi:MAG: hypothetical protein K2X82_06250 [Gemmataceae bacterium]|nr:hypothetical protein [Gemmataceae bacterium]